MTVPFTSPVTFPPCPPIPTATGSVQLLLPPTEDRPHRYFVLPNGLECVVISDPKADKAAASMDVGVGHLSDPEDLPGCAHFCEHLMFMGTKTYPKENDYSVYLSTHNGQSNAWTAMTSTNYYFDVAPDALEGALDRFSGFFVEPLFAEDCTEREINAVNSEHKKNLQSDLWRFFQLEKSLSKPGHPYGKFGTGNLETLWTKPKEAGRDPRQQLIEWWDREYCARRMKLAVAGRDDLDTLERLVRERFDKVPIRTEGRPLTGPDGVRVTFEDHPMGPEQLGRVTFTKPVRDSRGLEISIPMPDISHFYGTKPGTFAGHYLGHEGKGSVLSYLKAQGWVNTLRAGGSHEASGFGFFKVTVELTPEGLEHWKDVALAIFKYMNLLRSQPPSETTFNEIRRMADIGYQFAERGRTRDYVTHIAGWMQSPVPREKIVSSVYVYEEFDPQWLAATISLLDPSRASIGITCKTLPKDVAATATFDKKEAIYGTEYHQEQLSESFMKEATSGAPIEALRLPGPNLFIPEKLDVEKLDVEQPALRPIMLRDTDVSRLWYKKDDLFWMPKANVHVTLQTPLLDATPRNAVLGRLLCDLFTDATTEDVYDAEIAELSFGLWYSGNTLSLSVNGFSDKLAVLAETMLQKLISFEVDPARFEKIVDQVRLAWKNFELGEPYHVAFYWAAYATDPGMWTQQEKLVELEHVKPADVQAFAKEVFQRLYIETLIHGNTTAAGANEIQDMLERVIHPRALSPAEKAGSRSLLLPESSEHVWELKVANPAEPNSCVIHYTQMGDIADPAVRARLALLAQIASEPAFNVLRTKEQLGYVCQLSAAGSVGTVGIRVLVQSERDPVYVESRIESFLSGLQATIEDMTEEEFERHRKTLIEKREEKPKNLSEETRRFWHRITDKYYEFGKRETDIVYLAKTTKADVLDLYLTALKPSSSTRRKLSTHLRSQYRGVKFDTATAGPLIAGFTSNGVPVDLAALQTLLASGPDLAKVKEFANAAVDQASEILTPEATAELKAMVEDLKGQAAVERDADGSAETALKEGNVYIDNIHSFKSGLTTSKAPVPLEPLQPVAKL